MASLTAPRTLGTGIALVRDGRLLVASGALVDVTGYTRGELTSPEFRLTHVVRGELPWPERPHEPVQRVVELTPLRGDATSCVATCWRVDDETLLLLLEPGESTLAEEPRELTRRVVQSAVRACSSELAGVLMRLRRIQIDLESLEHARTEVLEREMRRLGPALQELQRLDDTVRGLTLAFGTR